MPKKYYLILAVFIIFTSGCVSKKKFLEMQTGRINAEKLAAELDQQNKEKALRIEALIEDFEAMKNELLFSSTVKDQYIDSLKSQIYVLNENLNKQKESLKETSFNLGFEKQRLTNAIRVKDQSIAQLEERVASLEQSISEKNSVIDQRNFDLKRTENQVNVLEGKLTAAENKQTTLRAELDKVRKQTKILQKQIGEKDTEISKLQNNVKLLKSQLGN